MDKCWIYLNNNERSRIINCRKEKDQDGINLIEPYEMVENIKSQNKIEYQVNEMLSMDEIVINRNIDLNDHHIGGEIRDIVKVKDFYDTVDRL